MEQQETPSTPASSETPAETTGQTTEGTQQTAPKTYTQEEYDRYGQSQASKGKNDILKSMGVASVQDVLDMRARNQEMEAAKAESDKRIAELTKQAEDAQNVAQLTKLGVDESHFDDVLILAKAKKADGETLAQAVEKVVKSNAQWTTARTPAARTGAVEGTPTKERDELREKLAQEFPWLKK